MGLTAARSGGLWLAALTSAVVSCSHGIVAWHGVQVVEEAVLSQLETALASVEEALWERHRPASSNYAGAGLHRSAYVGSAIPQSLLASLRDLAQRADREAGWGPFAGSDSDIHLRSALVAEYSPGEPSIQDTTAGWQRLGTTPLTLLLPLQGEELDLEVRQRLPELAKWHATTRRGDAAAWRGWHEHRVLPVAKGTARRSLLLEFWTGQEATREMPRPFDDDSSLDVAMNLEAESPTLQLALAGLREEQGRAGESDKAFQRAISLDPTWEGARGEYGSALAMRGALEDAEGHFRAAVELEPTSARAHRGLGQVCFDMGRAEEAEGHLRRALGLNPADASLLSQLGSLQADAAEAERLLMQAVELDPLDPVSHHRLGVFQAERGELPLAEESLQASVRLQPISAAQYDLGVLYASLGKSAAAISAYKKAATALPGDVRPLVNLGLLYTNSGKHKQAESSFKGALKIVPGDAKALMGLSDLQTVRGQLGDAIKTLRRAVEAEPMDSAAHLKLGLALWNKVHQDGKDGTALTEAEGSIKTAIEVDPGNPEAFHNLGLLYKAQGRLDLARQNLEAALDLRPEDSHYREELELVDGDEEEDEDFPGEDVGDLFDMPDDEDSDL